MKKKIVSMLICLCMVVMSGCGESTDKAIGEVSADAAIDVSEDTLEDMAEKKPVEEMTNEIEYFTLPDSPEDSGIYVEPIEGIADDFIRGVDASEVLSLEESGVKFYSEEGNEQDVFRTLAQAGVNYIRLRVWNNPYDKNGNGYGGGNCDVDTAIELGNRATMYGMKVMIDFHYSDFWADPLRQLAPKEWAHLTIADKTQALHDFTYESLEKMIAAGVNVTMVQVGNETNYGIAGEKEWDRMVPLFTAGCDAVREIAAANDMDIKVLVHYTNIQKAGEVEGNVKNLIDANVDFDIVGLSYYPYWHGSFEKLDKTISAIRTDYGKDVVVVETSYPYTLEDGDATSNTVAEGMLVKGYDANVQYQSAMLRNICQTVDTAGGLGVVYWGGIWIPVGTGNAATDKEAWEKYGSGWASSYAVKYDPENVGEWYGGTAWDNQALFDFKGHPLDSLYTFRQLGVGTTTERPKDYLLGALDEEEENSDAIIRNAGFEDDDTSMWAVSYEGDSNPTDYQDNPSDAYTGDIAFHFWSEKDMNFEISQELFDVSEGKYSLSLYAQGGDMNDSADMEMFVSVNGKETTERFMVDGWCNWQCPTIKNIEVKSGDKVIVGARIKAPSKSWGTLDDFKFDPE